MLNILLVFSYAIRKVLIVFVVSFVLLIVVFVERFWSRGVIISTRFVAWSSFSGSQRVPTGLPVKKAASGLNNEL